MSQLSTPLPPLVITSITTPSQLLESIESHRFSKLGSIHPYLPVKSPRSRVDLIRTWFDLNVKDIPSNLTWIPSISSKRVLSSIQGPPLFVEVWGNTVLEREVERRKRRQNHRKRQNVMDDINSWKGRRG